MNTVVDIQGFASDTGDFIPKEIAVISDEATTCVLIEPPFSKKELSFVERKSVHWVEKNKMIKWNDGLVPYNKYRDSIKFLKENNVYVKGQRKMAWLQRVLYDDDSENESVDEDDALQFRGRRQYDPLLHNLEDYDCPSFTDLYKKYDLPPETVVCEYHSIKSKCAVINAHYLAKWCEDNEIFV